MAYGIWQAQIVDASGDILAGALVTVRVETSGSPLATIYSDRDGVSTASNPVIADSSGYVSFFVAGGFYKITAALNGYSRVWRYVGIGMAHGSDQIIGYTTTSVTSLSIGLGSKAFTIVAGLPYTVGTRLLAASAADPTNFMEGYVASYTSTTLTLTVDKIGGSGTHADWNINLSGQPGSEGTVAGLRFNFDDDTAMTDPGTGNIRFNHATLSSATAAAISDLSAAAGNPDLSAAVLSWDDSNNTIRGTLVIKNITTPSSIHIYNINASSVDGSGFTQVALAHVGGSGTFAVNDELSLEFTRAGQAGTSGGSLVPPQGRVTLSATDPRSTTAVQATTIYYLPDEGADAPLRSLDSSPGDWVVQALAALSLPLDSDSGHAGYHQSGKIFSLWLDYNAGTPRLVSGPAWTSDTVPSVDWVHLDGIKVNAAQMTIRFGTSAGNTAVAPAESMVWVGDFFCAANGRCDINRGGFGAPATAAVVGISNAYNRIPFCFAAGNTTSSWTYNSTTFRSANADALVRCTFVRAFNDTPVVANVLRCGRTLDGNTGATVGVGLDRTNGNDAQIGSPELTHTAVANGGGLPLAARYNGLPGRGLHFLQAVEATHGSTTATFFGGTFVVPGGISGELLF